MNGPYDDVSGSIIPSSTTAVHGSRPEVPAVQLLIPTPPPSTWGMLRSATGRQLELAASTSTSMFLFSKVQFSVCVRVCVCAHLPLGSHEQQGKTAIRCPISCTRPAAPHNSILSANGNQQQGHAVKWAYIFMARSTACRDKTKTMTRG